MRFYLDEDLSHKIAAIARSLGVDVTSSHELGRNGIEDEHQLLNAAREGRCVVTQNHRHFIPLSRRFEERGLPHAGVLLIPRSLPAREFALIAAALRHFDRQHPDGIEPYSVYWLTRPPSSDAQ